MREIKFRAWSKKNRGFIADFNMVNFHSYFNKGTEPHIYRYGTEWKLSEIELMQYTGLKDKNGVEIYEGDILSINPDDDDWEDIVVWWQFGGRHELKTFADNPEPSTMLRLFELQAGTPNPAIILGNIYENPELINTKLTQTGSQEKENEDG